jgi:hypothetical protein
VHGSTWRGLGYFPKEFLIHQRTLAAVVEDGVNPMSAMVKRRSIDFVWEMISV